MTWNSLKFSCGKLVRLLPVFAFFICSAYAVATEDSETVTVDSGAARRKLLAKGESMEVLLVFMFVGMLLGALINHILSRAKLNIPYTVVVFLVGVALYVIVDKTGDYGQLEKSVKRWRDIDPELLLYVFLPALLFGEAMNLSWYKAKACFYQAALLAGPGVLIGAYLMALILYYVLPFEWSWYLCVVFGSIVAATDPVAVVAILKELGASPKLTILIVGESLLNDGTAMVLFALYFQLMEGKTFGGGDIIWFMVKMILCSPLLGVALGLVGVFWMSKANNPLSGQDTTIQICITVCTAYLTFYVAEYECEMSGILACCAAGLVFAFVAPPLILEQETMHSVWGFIEWTGNTLVFLLAGVIIGANLENKNISTTDFGYVLALYLIILLVRCLVIAVLYPGLSKLGLKCSAADAKFMCWAGLRGALAISLALIVYGEYDKIGITEKDADRLFFWIGGIAALTLLVNATTAQHLLIFLGLLRDETDNQAESTLNVVKESMRKTLFAEMKAFRNSSCNRFSTRKIQMAEIVKMNTLLSEYEDPKKRGTSNSLEYMAAESSNGSFSGMVPSTVLQRHFSHGNESIETGVSPVIDVTMLAYYRRMFLESIRRKYWRFIEEGRLPRGESVSTTLLYSVDTALRRISYQGRRDWLFLEKRFTISPEKLTFINKISDWIPSWVSKIPLRDRLISWNSFLKVYVLTSFIDAHEETQENFVNTLMGVSIESEENMLVEQQKVLNESKESVAAAKAALQSIDQHVVAAILIQQTARLLLAKEIQKVRHHLDEGVLQPRDADKLFTAIQADYKRLDAARFETYEDNVQCTVHNRLSMLMNSAAGVAPRQTNSSLQIDAEC